VGGGEILSTCPDRPWGQPSLLYNGYWVFPGGKSGRGVLLTPHPTLVSWSRKSRAIPLLPLGAVRPVQGRSACKRVHFTLPLLPSTITAYNYPITPSTLTTQIFGTPNIQRHPKYWKLRRPNYANNNLQNLQSTTKMRLTTGNWTPVPLQDAEVPIFQTNRHMKAVRLSAVPTARLYPPENIPGTHLYLGWVDTRTILHPEGLCQWKIPTWHHRDSKPPPSGL